MGAWARSADLPGACRRGVRLNWFYEGVRQFRKRSLRSATKAAGLTIYCHVLAVAKPCGPIAVVLPASNDSRAIAAGRTESCGHFAFGAHRCLCRSRQFVTVGTNERKLGMEPVLFWRNAGL